MACSYTFDSRETIYVFQDISFILLISTYVNFILNSCFFFLWAHLHVLCNCLFQIVFFFSLSLSLLSMIIINIIIIIIRNKN